jgi:hypothetical protein
MIRFINTQENQGREDGSFEWAESILSDHYCVGLDLVSLLLEEEICVGIAYIYDKVATDSHGWVGCDK